MVKNFKFFRNSEKSNIYARKKEIATRLFSYSNINNT